VRRAEKALWNVLSRQKWHYERTGAGAALCANTRHREGTLWCCLVRARSDRQTGRIGTNSRRRTTMYMIPLALLRACIDTKYDVIALKLLF